MPKEDAVAFLPVQWRFIQKTQPTDSSVGNPQSQSSRYSKRLKPVPTPLSHVPSPPNNPLPAQQLRNHEVAHVLIRPVAQMTRDARDERDVEHASIDPKYHSSVAVFNAPTNNQVRRGKKTHSWILKSTLPFPFNARTFASSLLTLFPLSSASIHSALSPNSLLLSPASFSPPFLLR